MVLGMKIGLSFAAIAILLAISTLHGQDGDTQQQIKEAQEAAKRLGVKMPDTQKMMDEAAKEDAADSATDASIDKASPSPANSASASAPSRITVDVPAGAAKGSITFDGVTSELKFAGAFVDQKDDRKPVVLLLSDQKLPVEKWTSEFDMMRDPTNWSGIAAFVDTEGTVYRTDVHTKGRQSSVSGIFDVKINDPKNKDLTGVAKTESSGGDARVDVTFHATRK